MLLDRRHFLTVAGAAMLWPHPSSAAARLAKPIPKTGEMLPVIGMGTWITFNVGDDSASRDRRTDVLRAFFQHGGGMIDSSPMYGSAEEVVGDSYGRLGRPKALFSATKVWTNGKADGVDQIANSFRLWRLDRFSLFQIHNLVDWEDHLETLLEMKAAGKIRYVGITTSHGRRHRDFEEIMKSHPIDFAQMTYNIADRDVEARLLPVAKERGIAVIANRPFQRGHLINALQRHPLPEWAREFGCTNWPQFLLKFIVSHPAVNCAIPATSRVDHMHENMGAGAGRLPDTAERARMVRYVDTL